MANVALGAKGALGLEALKASQGFGILVAPNLKIVQLPLYEKKHESLQNKCINCSNITYINYYR